MKVRYDAYCGLNCGACPIGLANEQNDDNGLVKMAEEWNARRDDLNCTGCKTATTASFCSNCGMRTCAMDKGLSFCSECSDFPCDTIKDFRNDRAPHHSAIFENLEEIGARGVEAWLAEEENRWSCSSCGTRFTWYSESCVKCGEPLFNAVDQEKNLKNRQSSQEGR